MYPTVTLIIRKIIQRIYETGAHISISEQVNSRPTYLTRPFGAQLTDIHIHRLEKERKL